MTPEEKDRKILSELLTNSDRPQKTLSTITGLSESELTRRKQHMLDIGIIKKYTILIDYEKIGYHSTGYFIFSEKDKSKASSAALVDFLKAIPEITEINQVFGENIDFVLKITCQSNNDFFNVIGRIRAHDNVKSEGSFSAIVAEANKNEPGSPILGVRV